MHRIMLPIAISLTCHTLRGLCVSVFVSPTETDEPIEMQTCLFVWAKGTICIRWGYIHLFHPANTNE